MKALLLPLLAAPLHAQVLGAYEDFVEETNAISWFSLDFATDTLGQAFWYEDPAEPSATDIYTVFNQGNGVSLFASVESSEAYFVGNYTSAGIETLSSDIYIDDASSFGWADFFIFAGDVEYYSRSLEIDTAGWSTHSVSFKKDQWYYYDSDNSVDVPVTLTDTILSDVTFVGVNFFPSSAAADGQIVAIDRFGLFPDLTPPTLTLTKPTGEVGISFERKAGISYDLQMSQTLEENSWGNLFGIDSIDIQGEGTWEAFITTPPKAFFTIATYPLVEQAP